MSPKTHHTNYSTALVALLWSFFPSIIFSQKFFYHTYQCSPLNGFYNYYYLLHVETHKCTKSPVGSCNTRSLDKLWMFFKIWFLVIRICLIPINLYFFAILKNSVTCPFVHKLYAGNALCICWWYIAYCRISKSLFRLVVSAMNNV